MNNVEQLPLWSMLHSKAVDVVQLSRIRTSIEYASEMLDRVVETFPTYTLHNSAHAEKLILLMEKLLGDKCQLLRPLEAAFLLLSAFFHDIGMVFKEEEREQLAGEQHWPEFLNSKPDAYLAVKKAGGIPPHIAEWYCRWRHADRVFVHLNELPDDGLKWGVTSIREMLGEVCRSHNLGAKDLYNLPTEFRGEADLRFCAILLRLADILDFDRSRSPKAVYEYLGLSGRTESRRADSDVEWRKHLCSEGFRFPDSLYQGYKLSLIASPDEPGVEYDVRKFLDIIEGEMEECRTVLGSCSIRWRDLCLPGGVDRSHIQGNGYRYGEHRFTLDQGQVMDLLMGENLYGEPYVFVRELIQNALDASRHRRFIERSWGSSGFEPEPIRVRHWIDPDGYQWVRFDDNGMGMDETIVEKHLLKVGSSYYRSSEFRAEVLRAQGVVREDFVPISRFGIGLLSCFMAGDRVEISTLRRVPDGGASNPIRLSLNGLYGFFIMQTPNLPPRPMPSPDHDQAGYRLQPGTSIAIRLDPCKESAAFEIEKLVKAFVACPPAPVEFDGNRIGGDPVVLVECPWLQKSTVALSEDDLRSVGLLVGREISGPLVVEFLPIDLTRHSPTPELKGQMVLALFKDITQERALAATQALFEYGRAGELRLKLSTNYKHGEQISIESPSRRFAEIMDLLDSGGTAWLSHNGIAVPVLRSEFFPQVAMAGTWIGGVIALTDSLRPELSVSREDLRGFPWKFYSAAGLAFYRALSGLDVDLSSGYWPLFRMIGKRRFLLRDLLEDEYLGTTGLWSFQPIIPTTLGLRSLQDIRGLVARGPIEIVDPRDQGGQYLGWCAATLIQSGLNVSVKVNEASGPPKFQIQAEAGAANTATEGHKLFPPLTFIPFDRSGLLRARMILNSNHPFAAWLIEAAPELSRKYPGLFERIRTDLAEETNWFRHTSETLDRINTSLERLRELPVSLKPPRSLRLKEEDFHS